MVIYQTQIDVRQLQIHASTYHAKEQAIVVAFIVLVLIKIFTTSWAQGHGVVDTYITIFDFGL